MYTGYVHARVCRVTVLQLLCELQEYIRVYCTHCARIYLSIDRIIGVQYFHMYLRI